MQSTSTETGWRQKSPSRREALRELLSDGRWHGHDEMTRAGGARFGARLLELRRGADGGAPLEIVGEADPSDDSKWRYRAVVPNLAPAVERYARHPERKTLYLGDAKPVGRCGCGSVAHFCQTCFQCNAPGHQKCPHRKAQEASHA